VRLSGWLQYRRGKLFIVLRDTYGLTQCVFDEKDEIDGREDAMMAPLESVLSVEGRVRERPQGMANHNMPTGLCFANCFSLF
jgi:aspartyl-tRNA synthetase